MHKVLKRTYLSAACILVALCLQPVFVAHAEGLTAAGDTTWPVVIYPTQTPVPFYPFATCDTLPSQTCTSLPAPIPYGTYQALCQQNGETVSALGFTNNWWSLLENTDDQLGWVSNIFIKGGQQIAIPDSQQLIPYCP